MIIYLISASSGEPAKPAQQSRLKGSPHHLHHHSELMIIWVEENRSRMIIFVTCIPHICHFFSTYTIFGSIFSTQMCVNRYKTDYSKNSVNCQKKLISQPETG